MSVASDITPFSYDEVAYPTAVLAVQTPDRIRSAGILHGWNAPAVETASTLEIGCGDGLNLIGMAAVTPKGRFVGFDLSAEAIERGRALIEAAGLQNIELHQGNILDYPRTGDPFDYIVSNGVYAWTSASVRESLLELIAARLAPGGVAFCSYDCLPAAAAKISVNRFLVDHTPSDLEPDARMREALRLVALLSRHHVATSSLKVQLDRLVRELPDFAPGYFFHDFLSEDYAPISLPDFAKAAETVGLVVAGDAGLGDLTLADLDDEARALVDATGTDWPKRGGLIDLLRGTNMFRRSLLVRADAPPPSAEDGMTLMRYVAAASREEIETENGPRLQFTSGEAKAQLVPGQAEIAVLDVLIAAFPEECTFKEVYVRAGLPKRVAEEALRNVCVWSLADAHTTEQPYVSAPGDKPEAGILVRTMMALGGNAITPRHVQMVTDQLPTRYFLYLCDGTRTRADLSGEMTVKFNTDISLEKVEAAIADLAPRRVFVA